MTASLDQITPGKILKTNVFFYLVKMSLMSGFSDKGWNTAMEKL